VAGKSKRAQRVKRADDYLPRLDALSQALRPPREGAGIHAWALDEIRAARDLQLLGKFKHPAQLAASMKTDDAVYTAQRNRLAPAQGIPVELVPQKGQRAARVAAEADGIFGRAGVGLKTETITGIHATMADHGVAFAVNTLTPRADGSRIDLELHQWPIQHVEWDATQEAFYTYTRDGGRERIVHGDGRWTVFSQHEVSPWHYGAVVPVALAWADRAYGVRDRSRASTSHGNAKMVGELPEGIAIDSPEGAAFMLLLRTMHEALPYGIRPHGAKLDMMVNTSTSWQIFDSITSNRLKDIARVYLGHDGSVSATGGNYVKDGFLFGVSTSIVEADLSALERGIFEGAIEPWCALNFGDSTLAPRRVWRMPDADVTTNREDLAAATTAYLEAIEGYRRAGFVVDQAVAETLAERFGVAPLELKSESPSAPAASPAASSPETRQDSPPAPHHLRALRPPR